MKRETNPLALELRRAFVASGLSLNQLALRSATPYNSVHRFFTGVRDDAALVTVAKWCQVLQLQLAAKRPKRKKEKP